MPITTIGYATDGIYSGCFVNDIVLPELCRIYGNINDFQLSLSDINEVEIEFFIYPPPQRAGETILTTTKIKANIDINTGNFYADLAKGANARVSIVKCGLTRNFQVPSDRDKEKLITLINFAPQVPFGVPIIDP